MLFKADHIFKLNFIINNAWKTHCPTVQKGWIYLVKEQFKQYKKFILLGSFVSSAVITSRTIDLNEIKKKLLYAESHIFHKELNNVGKKRTGFRNRKVIEYENRIRRFSAPDKVFRYFATLIIENSKNNKSEICMTPDDFVRSLIPGIKQPDDFGLDKYMKCDPENIHIKVDINLNKDSIFYNLGSHGLITFSDYMFLLIVLTTDRHHFEMAFRIFDVDGDGIIDAKEFSKITSLFHQRSNIKNKHREKSYNKVTSAVMTYFFGLNMDQKLTVEKFLDFQQLLKRQLLELEFERKKPNKDEKITEVDFTKLVLTYAHYSKAKKTKVLKRIKKVFKNSTEGISKEDYLKFFHFLDNIYEVDTALTFYNVAGAAIDPETFKHVAKTVANVDLSDHIVNVVYTIFDENMDGELSDREFVSVMKKRALRGLNMPRDTGFSRFIEHILKYIKHSFTAI